jgi:hypothetical protein
MAANDYYVSVTGTIQAQSNPILAQGLKLAGWSGPYSMTDAKDVANNVAERIAASDATVAGAGSSTPATAASAANNASSAMNDIGNFFHELSEAAVWERAGEVLVGVLLLYIGLKGLATPAGQSVKSQTLPKTAKRIAEAAALA